MNITQIRNATQLITYAGKRFLIDPMLAPKGTYPGFPGTARADIRNPMVDLPVDVQTLLDADAVIVTHTHADHWDQYAVELIAKGKPIYVQNDSDAALLRSQGFTNLTIMTGETTYGDIRIVKTHGGQHGTDRAYAVPELAEFLGEACGVVFRHPDEKTLYIAGDTIWRDAVAADLQKPSRISSCSTPVTLMSLGLGRLSWGKKICLTCISCCRRRKSWRPIWKLSTTAC